MDSPAKASITATRRSLLRQRFAPLARAKNIEFRAELPGVPLRTTGGEGAPRRLLLIFTGKAIGLAIAKWIVETHCGAIKGKAGRIMAARF